jgi:hypothetical protein
VVGFRPTNTAAEWLAAAGLLLLYVLALSWLAAALGLLAGSVESASILSFFMLFLPYLSSAFVPTDTMPAVLRGFSDHQPVTPIIDTVRGLLTGTAIGVERRHGRGVVGRSAARRIHRCRPVVPAPHPTVTGRAADTTPRGGVGHTRGFGTMVG